MQARHKEPRMYFEEAATSCRNYYIPYITKESNIKPSADFNVLEIGCGLGGSLSVFAEMGCKVTGVDIQKRSVELALDFFADKGLEGTFICSDIFDFDAAGQRYDLIILHDSLEHIPEKERLMLLMKGLLKKNGVLYLGFPAWQMPFGGHQQMAKNKLVANFPYIHLLPRPLFLMVFKIFGETDGSIRYFLRLRDTGISIEGFERLVSKTGYSVVNRQLYFINPNYHIKFGLKPRKLYPLIAKTPYLRDFFTTTCYYLLRS